MQPCQTRHRNGTPLKISVRISHMHIGTERMFTFLIADITRRKADEDRLRDGESRYRELVETAHDMVWTMDSQGCLTYVNRACQDIYAYTPDEMLHHYLHEFRSPDHPPHDREAIEVVYIDHNHFHMVGDVEPYTTPNL